MKNISFAFQLTSCRTEQQHPSPQRSGRTMLAPPTALIKEIGKTQLIERIWARRCIRDRVHEHPRTVCAMELWAISSKRVGEMEKSGQGGTLKKNVGSQAESWYHIWRCKSSCPQCPQWIRRRAELIARGFGRINGEHYEKDARVAPVANDVSLTLLAVIMMTRVHSWPVASS